MYDSWYIDTVWTIDINIDIGGGKHIDILWMRILHISRAKMQKNKCIIPIQTLDWVKQMPSVGPFGIDQFSSWIVSQGQDDHLLETLDQGTLVGKS